MKKNIVTVLTAVVVAALIVLGVVFCGEGLTDNQRDTLRILIIICCCSAAYCFVVGELTQNFSQMDKLWSILPIVYAWVVAARGGFKTRLIVYALIVTAWGVRLTVNFARKGAYRLRFWDGSEDYRWSIVRQKPVFKSKAAWMLFDLLFISVYQNALVLAMGLPALAVMESNRPFGGWDIAAALLAVLFLALETAADEYQWRFHVKKQALLEEKGALEALPEPYDQGFNTTGPWARMRHPNYLGEQGIWLSLYLFTIGAGVVRGGVFHWTVTGPLLLILLFMGSSALSESISAQKYPMYKEYVGQVYKYVPLHRFERGRQHELLKGESVE